MRYPDVRDRIDDLDIILFRGHSPASRAIQFATLSSYSHVGLAMWDPARTMLLVLETAPETKIKDYFARSYRDGVQSVSMSSRVHLYHGTMFWRPLVFERTQAQRERLWELRREMSEIHYERRFGQLLHAAAGGAIEDRSSLFCSELVAHVLKETWVLAERLPACAYVPEDFSTESDREIRWAAGVRPSLEVPLDRSVA